MKEKTSDRCSTPASLETLSIRDIIILGQEHETIRQSNADWTERLRTKHGVICSHRRQPEPKICSDHSPVLTTMIEQIWKRKAGFKYDQRWIKREGFPDAVKEAW
ncbi:unnamed protein product, partial [Brassica oleracea var. botrytis]